LGVAGYAPGRPRQLFVECRLVSILNEMRTQHLLLVVDACYGATVVSYQVMTNRETADLGGEIQPEKPAKP
jgi:hypothetical protein